MGDTPEPSSDPIVRALVALDRRFETVETKIDAHSKEVARRIDGLDRSFEEVKRKQKEVADDYIAKGEFWAKQLFELGDRLRKEVIAITSKFESMDQLDAEQNKKLSDALAGLTSVVEMLKRVEEKVGGVSHSVTTLMNAVVEMNQRLNTLHNNLIKDATRDPSNILAFKKGG